VSDKLVLLKRAISQGEALVTKSFLESHNIPVYLMDHDDVLNFNGIRLMVFEHNLEDAAALLETTDLTVDE
tara:strand:+ start:401 stop:613 length:213 start_codon:yes stop_codon:yes gene_type:complete